MELALIRRHEPEFERERLLTLLQGSVRPVAVVSIAFRPDALSVEAFRSAGIPIVVIDEQVEGTSTVACDSSKGGYLAGQHFLALGRRAPALVCGDASPGGHYNAVLRRRGFEKALAEKGIALPEEHVFEVEEYSRKDGIDAVRKFLGGARMPDAVFCAAGDNVATGILAAARAARLKVPEQLAVMGFDDIPLAAISEPPLTTFRQPMDGVRAET